MKDELNWAEDFPMAITVCDREANIIYMNRKSELTFQTDGGIDLIGKSLYDCHPESANAQIREMLASGKENIYTIEKNGIKKMILQVPHFSNGICQGLVEISVPLPEVITNFKRS